MAMLLADLKLHAQHAVAVDATLPPAASATSDAAACQIVNTAGRYLFKHLWNFRIAPPAILGFSAPITIANGTWTTSSKTLTKTSGFTNYTFAYGDIINITDGTGGTTGKYHIASRTSANAIVLSTDPGFTDGSADVDGSISFPYVNLPSDFGDLIGYEMNGTAACIELGSVQDVLSLRLKNITSNGNSYVAAIVHPGQTAITGTQPVARLELDHAPSAADPDAMFVFYRRKWTTLANTAPTADYSNTPDFADDLLIEYVRAFAEGYMNRHAEETGILPTTSLNDRLHDIDDGPVFHMTKEYDGSIQSDYGPIGHGPAGYPYTGTSWRSRSSSAVADPS